MRVHLFHRPCRGAREASRGGGEGSRGWRGGREEEREEEVEVVAKRGAEAGRAVRVSVHSVQISRVECAKVVGR